MENGQNCDMHKHNSNSVPDSDILIESGPKSPNSLKGISFGLALAGATGLSAVALSVISFPFISPALRKICLPFVPATDQQVSNVIKALKGKKGKTIDLGSGDGRIVFSIANHYKSSVVGIEMNPWLVLYSKYQTRMQNLSKYAQFSKEDLWKHNLSSYQNIVIFGVEEMMPELQKKLEQELTTEANIIACRFPLPDWNPSETYGEGIDAVWSYKLKNRQLPL